MIFVDDDDYSEYTVCKINDFNNEEGEKMKQVDLGEIGKCLLIRHKDSTITAIGHKCTHYGAPLINGVLANGRVRCPWHGACFNARTGDIEDFPGLDGLQSFKVRLKGNDVVVGARRRQFHENKRNDLLAKTCSTSAIPSLASPSKNGYCVVIIGGGPSSVTCSETLRKEGFKGRIIILSKEIHPPYDRPKLSKVLDVEPEKAYLRPESETYFRKIGVELYNDSEVSSVDVLTKSVRLCKPIPDVTTNGGLDIKFDALVIATGGEPRTLKPSPGWDLENVFVLRTISDANAIAKACQGKRVAIVGSSFIGMEVASFLASKAVPSSLSVICGRRSSVPFENSLGKEVGEVVKKLHEEKGSVKFYPNTGVQSLTSKNHNHAVTHVTLSNGATIEADVVVVGVGVTPATSFLRTSEIRMTDQGFVTVDGRMQTKVPHVYAIGDIVMFPLQAKGGSLVNIQHWQMAHTHGRIAALDIMNTIRKINRGLYTGIEVSTDGQFVTSVPFFWTVQYGVSIRYAGHGAGYDDIVIRGKLEEQKFVAYYLCNDVVVAVATMKADPTAARFAENMYAGKVLKRGDIPNNL